MIHLELFWSFFQIGLFSIGGGYAAMPLIQHQVVELHPWLTLEQFSDIITISQMTPGPIAINSATFVGLQLGGLPGALVATAGCVLPSCIIVLTLAYVYYRYRGLSMVQGVLAGLRPAVVAMIASAGVTLVNLSFFGADALPAGLADVDLIAVLLFAAALFVLRRWKKDPILVMAGAGAAGLVLYGIAPEWQKPPRTAKRPGRFLHCMAAECRRNGRGGTSQKTCREAPAVPSVPGLRAFCNSIACSVFP